MQSDVNETFRRLAAEHESDLLRESAGFGELLCVKYASAASSALVVKRFLATGLRHGLGPTDPTSLASSSCVADAALKSTGNVGGLLLRGEGDLTTPPAGTTVWFSVVAIAAE